MKMDYFIHPEHAIRKNIPSYDKYIEHLKRVYEISDFPVLIDGINSGDFSKWFSLENRVESASIKSKNSIEHRGEVSPDDWDKFENIVDEGDRHILHGSFFGKCVDHFAYQLFGYLVKGEHWHDWWGNGDKNKVFRELKKVIMHEDKGDFSDSGIKYGVTLAPSERIDVLKPHFSFLNDYKLHGDIRYQLIDEESTIYNCNDVHYL